MKHLKSYKDFKREKYIKERVEEIIQYICSNDTEYKNYSNDFIRLSHELQKALPIDKQSIVLKYEDIMYSKFQRILDLLVKQILEEVGNFEKL